MCDDLFNLLSIIISVVTLIISSVTFYLLVEGLIYSKKQWEILKGTTRYQGLSDVFHEYSTDEIGYSLKILWDTYRQCEKKRYPKKIAKLKKLNLEERKLVEEDFIAKYKKDYKKVSKFSADNLHVHRRRVSLFFQRLAILSEDLEYKKIISEIWKVDELKTIPVILEPLEMRALPGCTGDTQFTIRRNYPLYMKKLLRFAGEPDEDINHTNKSDNQRMSGEEPHEPPGVPPR